MSVRKPELFLIYGETDATSTSGDFSLKSDIFYSAVTYIRIPKGLKVKVWFKKVSGDVETKFTLNYTHDVTVTSPTWITVDSIVLASKGELAVEKRKPIILRGFTGKEAFKISWEQPSAGKAYVVIGVEM